MSATASAGRGETGFTLVEALVGMALAIIVMLAMYSAIESNSRQYTAVMDLTAARTAGRASLEVMSSELRHAGYSPLGVEFDAIAEGNGYRLRLLADLDGDGTVGTATETDENVTYEFWDADGDELFELYRGVDLNGDGDFEDADESRPTMVANVVQIDQDGDGSLDLFLRYDEDPPATKIVRIAYGVRTDHRDITRKEYPVTSFHTTVELRNEASEATFK